MRFISGATFKIRNKFAEIIHLIKSKKIIIQNLFDIQSTKKSECLHFFINMNYQDKDIIKL